MSNLSDAQIAFLRDNVGLSNKSLVKAFNAQFNATINYSQLIFAKYKHRIIKQEQRPYTEADKQFVRDNYLKMGDMELAERMGRTFKSVEKLRRTTMGLLRPPNVAYEMRCKNSQKAGQETARKVLAGELKMPHYRNAGEIYLVKGRWYIKPDKNALIRPISYPRWLWEHAHGKIPKGYNVRYVTGETPKKWQDITLDTIECVTMSEACRKVSESMNDNYVNGRIRIQFGKDYTASKEILELKRAELLIKRVLSTHKQSNDKKN